MEITTYTARAGLADALAAARPAITEAIGELHGLVRVQTVELGDGRRADMAVWRDADAHVAAMRPGDG